MSIFHRHKWEETSISFKISSSPTASVYEHVTRHCRKCGEKQAWASGVWVKYDKSLETTKKLYQKAAQLMAELMKESIND